MIEPRCSNGWLRAYLARFRLSLRWATHTLSTILKELLVRVVLCGRRWSITNDISLLNRALLVLSAKCMFDLDIILL